MRDDLMMHSRQAMHTGGLALQRHTTVGVAFANSTESIPLP